MANYDELTRTNYFRVKDIYKFRKAVARVPSLELIFDRAKTGEMLVGLMAPDEPPTTPRSRLRPVWLENWYYRFFCSRSRWDKWLRRLCVDEEQGYSLDLAEFLVPHLAPKEVAVVMKIGNEKMRYLNGYAMAVNSRGETRQIALYSIYNLAEELTDEPGRITAAEY